MSSNQPEIYMCRPTFYGVQYEINPWMRGQIGKARGEVAAGQWNRLFEIIDAKASVMVIKSAPNLPDMCFVANAGIIVGEHFVPARYRFRQREPETPLFQTWFEQSGYSIITLDGDASFEGEGDALLSTDLPVGRDPWMWAGYGIRSSLEAFDSLCEKLAVEIVPLRLIDERFYHLDTCLFPLPGGRVVYYPPAFDEVSLNEIRRRVAWDDRIEVSEPDAVHFACNAVRIDDSLITNCASRELKNRLKNWDYDVVTTPLDEFMLAGGAAKCLCLMSNPTLEAQAPRKIVSPIRQTHFEVQGHLLDSGLMNRLFDAVTEGGGTFRVEQFVVGQRHDEPSSSSIRVTAPNAERLELIGNQLQSLGAKQASAPVDARLEAVVQNGVAPQSFYSTTIYPTDVRVDGQWIRAERQRMDAVIVVDRSAATPAVRCSLIRELKPGENVVCGVDGVRVNHPAERQHTGGFAFMSSGVSSERRVERVVEELAWEMRQIRSRNGRIVVVAGPVVIHTGGGKYLANIIRRGYINALLTGNALPTHDIELNLFGTSLGVDLTRGLGVHGGHQHHIKTINRIRAAGSIRAAVEQGIITEGVMHACVEQNVEYVLAGSIRDDGPLPETMMDLYQAQAAYAKAIDNADMIIMLASMLHAIGTGNMCPAGVQLVCVDISPSVVTKLADRGSIESTGIVTDVGLFLNLLDRQLAE